LQFQIKYVANIFLFQPDSISAEKYMKCMHKDDEHHMK